jgi:hypothetical protein
MAIDVIFMLPVPASGLPQGAFHLSPFVVEAYVAYCKNIKAEMTPNQIKIPLINTERALK